jgi:hypothetical protein
MLKEYSILNNKLKSQKLSKLRKFSSQFKFIINEKLVNIFHLSFWVINILE